MHTEILKTKDGEINKNDIACSWYALTQTKQLDKYHGAVFVKLKSGDILKIETLQNESKEVVARYIKACYEACKFNPNTEPLNTKELGEISANMLCFDLEQFNNVDVLIFS